MGLTVYSTRYGRPAAEMLHARIAEAKADDPLAQVTVLVPTNFVGVSMRRLLGSGRLGPLAGANAGVAGLRILTVHRLAELLGAPHLAGSGRRPVSTPVIAAAVRAELAVDPGVFEPVKDHPATEEALVRAHRELTELGPDGLDRLASKSRRAADVVALCGRVRQRLAGHWYDETDLLGAATEAVRGPAPFVTDLGALVLHLPQRLGRPSTAFLRALAERCTLTVVVGLAGDPAADADIRRTLDRLGGDAEWVPAPADGPAEAQADGTSVVVTSDADDEVRACVRAVMDAARQGLALERIAVLYPSADPYARLLSEHFEAAGIPRNGQAVRSLADRVAGRWLLDALALPDRDFARDRVLRVLAAAPGPGGAGCRYPIASFERVSREAGVLGGDDWQPRLAGFARRCRSEAADERRALEPRAQRIDRLEDQAAHADRLAGEVAELRQRLAEARSLTSWSGLAAWARSLLHHSCGSEDVWEEWPAAERDAACRVDAALDRLAVLDSVDPSPSVPVFRRTLELELGADLGRDGRFGEGVLVGELSAGLGIDLDLVIVCGLAEGVLPGHVHEDSLLPDVERVVVADDLPPRAERVGVQRRYVVAALAAGRERLLCYPRGDLRRSVERPPSRWLLDAVADLPGDRPARPDGSPDTDVLPRTAPWLQRVPSFDAGIRRSEPATEQEYRLRALAEHRFAGGWVDDHPIVRHDDALRRALTLYRARRSASMTRFDGDLSGVEDLAALVPSAADAEGAVAPTRLEAYARCPHAYLLEHVLRIGPVEDPEESLQISPLELGSLVHDILDRWMREVLDDPPPFGAPYSARHRLRIREIADECCDVFVDRGVTGHPRLWATQRQRIIRDLLRLCERDDEHRAANRLRPAGTEMSFGIDDETPVAVALPDGRKMRFRGRLDRLDADPEGGLVVTDYKTGSGNSDEYRWLARDPVARGRLLQLPVYALAARQLVGGSGPVRAQYWFCTDKGEFRYRSVDLDDESEDRFRSVLATMVRSIESGLFPPVPPPPSGKPFVECAYCDPDGMGTGERRRDWERKRGDARLAELVGVLEPQEDQE
jgi:ATP-dependent helicase/nuclease subunit B